MPRTVIYDLKGGFGSLRQINALYEVQQDGPPQGLWNGRTVVQRQQPIEASAYQQSLDAGLEPPELTTSTVRYWSDFNRVFFHPRSIVQLNEYELNSSLVPFERWDTGEDLFSSLDKENDLLDRDIRPFAEEADQMQAIQIMTTVDDAWGGFASRYIERLRDEYGKTTIWTWGLQDAFPGLNREKRLLRLVNKAKSLTEIYKQASLLVPLAIPQHLSPHSLALDSSSAWHTSALLSTAIESATLPSRLKDLTNRDSLGNIGNLLNVHGKQTVAHLQMSIARSDQVPRSENVGDEPSDGLRLDIDFRPPDDVADSHRQNGFNVPKIFSQVLATRGERADEEDEEENDGDDREDAAHRRRNDREALSRTYRSQLSYPTPDSFPKIFRGDDGEILAGPISVSTALTTDTALSQRLRLLRSTVVRSIGVEDRETLSNDLAEMADEYHEGWSSGSDEGEDD
ncbi:putative misato segment ii myosin-like domain-containing protein [Phaeoacremonium minimum UCRPA7]|uniref:Putative misato segment ii myosin-like domain-containing protein n=1 Tax=Phaeoacremonium minimum (strain UCR-PA7) TaxID=1286976 RepID=R8BFG1_PHAM7|nr:putative misato segment ii myosin-like domain-containing protein [Phaeoacremonium minimum UCRPA7]EON98038.1 putative misato segment ii myosin-like domain-containing protein [Phaeoacremonium minimum UCRPA7]